MYPENMLMLLLVINTHMFFPIKLLERLIKQVYIRSVLTIRKILVALVEFPKIIC